MTAPTFAPHVKGLELPGYDPRGLHAMALGLAVGTRGADHNRSGAYEADFSSRADRRQGGPQSAIAAIETEDKAAIMDSLILCKFLRGVFSDFYSEAAEMLGAVTGWPFTAVELRTTATRIVNARKCFNQREGWTAEEDTLPSRFFAESPGRSGCLVPLAVATGGDDRGLLRTPRMDPGGPGPRWPSRRAGACGPGLGIAGKISCLNQITSASGSGSSRSAIGRPLRSDTLVAGSMPRLW